MNMRTAPPAVLPGRGGPPSIERTLRRLFLMLFLRGRTSRGIQKGSAPRSVATKLGLTLLFYGLFGLFALSLGGQPVFALSIYLHAMTFVFLGMFVAGSTGEVLFNKEEAEILLHRPVSPGTLLRAKIAVLVQVSLWLAGALNLAGFFTGVRCPDGGWLFPPAHALSTMLEALFCTGSVVLIYQLCLRCFGREKLDGLMTTAQVGIAIFAVMAGQLAPQFFFRLGGKFAFDSHTAWLAMLPPAWFAGLDDAIAGTRTTTSWVLGSAAICATVIVLWLAFGKLARTYERGVQSLTESAAARTGKSPGRRRLLQKLAERPPLKWWLRDSVSRAAFLLTAAYLARDRDVKLRVYPGLAPMLVMPFVFLIQDFGRGSGHSPPGFGLAFSGAYLGLIPLLGLNLLRYSQQWQASDILRAAPMPGPAALCHGVRRAVLCFLALPMVVFFAAIGFAIPGQTKALALLLPGLISLPVYALIPCLNGKCVPLSLPSEEAKSANRSLNMIGVMMISMLVAGIATWAWNTGWFVEFIAGELLIVIILYAVLRRSMKQLRWAPIE